MTSQKDFKNALTSLERTDLKKSAIENKKFIKTIHSHANSVGLSQESIIRVVRLGTCGRFNQALANTLIQSLIPKESIPEEAVIYGISRITAGICQLRVQATILKWIITLFDIISPKFDIYSFYGMLFNLLDYETLCPYICHLLYLMTRQQDVTHFRISRLMLLQKKVGNQSYISGLMTVYRLYQPSLITVAKSKKGRFKKIEQSWKANIFEISSPLASKQDYLGVKSKGCIIPTVKPQITDIINEFDRPFDTVSYNRLTQTSDIKSLDDLITSLGKTTLPSRAASLLSTRCLKHILAISPDSSLKIRLRLWLHERFYSRFSEDDIDCEKHEERELLKLALDQQELFQMNTTLQEPLLYSYLETWSSGNNTDLVLKIISKLPIMPFSILHKNVLLILEKHFVLAPSTSLRCAIIESLTELTCNYIAVESQNSDTEARNFRKDIENLVAFIDGLIVLGIFLTKSSTRFIYSGLEFWRTMTLTLKQTKLDVVVLPHFLVVYKGLFTPNRLYLSCICATITSLIGIYTINLKGNRRIRHSSTLEMLNNYITDFHDSLWRHSAFHPACSENSIAYKGLESDVVKEQCGMVNDISVMSSFSIDKHPALIICTARYVKENNIVSEQALSSELLLTSDYIKYLKKEGLYDVLKLLQQLTDLSDTQL
uniref:centromere protein I-like n=1 Tax=Styela clava TaxID=7725 RepID=UPI00193A3B5B|nr:centromere protein I-like [Styela clava]